MNKIRRGQIGDVIDKISDLKDIVELLLEEEQEYFDNMPCGIQVGEKGGRVEEIIGNLSSASESLDEVIIDLQSAIEL